MNIFFIIISSDATTLLGTSRKIKPESTEHVNNKGPTKQDDFKTVYAPKTLPEVDKETPKNKLSDINEQYKVVDSTYVYIRLKHKLVIFILS